MAGPTLTAPLVLADPGYIFWSPLGTAVPTHTVAASKFTDVWNSPWIWLGATTDGSEFQNTIGVEYIRAAEFFDPVGSSITERSGQLAFSLMDYTFTKLQKILNGGTITVVSGTGATTLTKFTPPGVTGITRCALGWESTDGTLRKVMYQCLNAGDVTSAFRKAPDAAVLPAAFSFEIPTGSTVPWESWAAGTARAA